jgi:hypothetical protein
MIARTLEGVFVLYFSQFLLVFRVKKLTVFSSYIECCGTEISVNFTTCMFLELGQRAEKLE